MNNQKPKPDLYISVDVETTGDVPGFHSMISLGAVAFTRDGQILDRFSTNIEPLPGTIMDPSTQEFWNTWPDAYAATQTLKEMPTDAMRKFAGWVDTCKASFNNKHAVFIGYPATFDFMWIAYYFKLTGVPNPFGFVGLDLKTLGFSILNMARFDMAKKGNFPVEWFGSQENHTHVALQDAIDQANLAISMFKALDKLQREAMVTRKFSEVTSMAVKGTLAAAGHGDRHVDVDIAVAEEQHV